MEKVRKSAEKKVVRRDESKHKGSDITVKSAVIIDEKGCNLGCMGVVEARALASGKGVDLVQVS